MVKESKHLLRGCIGALICPWSLHLMVPMFDTLDVVYVRGGGGECIDLVGWPIHGGQAWLKNLSISKGMLRQFNSSMVIGTCLWPRSYVVCSVCSWGVH